MLLASEQGGKCCRSIFSFSSSYGGDGFVFWVPWSHRSSQPRNYRCFPKAPFCCRLAQWSWSRLRGMGRLPDLMTRLPRSAFLSHRLFARWSGPGQSDFSERQKCLPKLCPWYDPFPRWFVRLFRLGFRFYVQQHCLPEVSASLDRLHLRFVRGLGWNSHFFDSQFLLVTLAVSEWMNRPVWAPVPLKIQYCRFAVQHLAYNWRAPEKRVESRQCSASWLFVILILNRFGQKPNRQERV